MSLLCGYCRSELNHLVQQVAVEHIKADLVIHYGDACMSKVEDIPVYYAFEHTPIDIDSFICSFRERFGGSKKLRFIEELNLELSILVMIYLTIIVFIRYMKL